MQCRWSDDFCSAALHQHVLKAKGVRKAANIFSRLALTTSALALLGASDPHGLAKHPEPAGHKAQSVVPAHAPEPAPVEPAPPAPLPQPDMSKMLSPAAPPPARLLPGFAPQLADRPMISGPSGWVAMARQDAWDAIAISTPENRQAARWDYALGLLAQAANGFADDLGGLAGDALGVLDVMAQDDPDLLLVPSFRLARGVVLARVGRGAEAVESLSDPLLMANPEACVWRLVAHESIGNYRQALSEASCAVKAINQRKVPAARPFILAASRAAVLGGQPKQALSWLGNLPDIDASANLLRGKAELALGRLQEARLRFDRVNESGSEEEKADAQLSLIEGQSKAAGFQAKEALKALDRRHR
jgi:tetratricopeptide (TPR) repeat protein